MQSSLKKSEFCFKAIGVASFANMTCSALALAEMLQPNQKPFILPDNLKSATLILDKVGQPCFKDPRYPTIPSHEGCPTLSTERPSLAPLKNMQIFKVEKNNFAQNTCSIERDSVCEF